VSECDRETSIMSKSWPLGAVAHWEKKYVLNNNLIILIELLFISGLNWVIKCKK